MDRNLALNLARVTEAAALASAKFLGRGDKNAADQAAVDAMRRMFDTVNIDGVVVIGEGEIDEAPMLYIGEQIGIAGPDSLKIDIAVDPLDGTSSIAYGRPDAVSVVAIAPRGCMLHAPDTYMKKIAVGPKAAGVIDINAPIEDNIAQVAKALDKDVSEVTITMLDRPRHNDLVASIRKAGARIRMITDGDVIAAINTCFENTGVDMMVGIGGAPEGVITAAALKCMGGEFQGILHPVTEEQKRRCIEMGVDLNKVYKTDDLVKGDEIVFAATGVSHGELLQGVKYLENNVASTHTLVLRAETGTIRFIEATHKLDKKPEYAK
ncbi:class II fructose-bisphosphatase [Tissierella carlieri]|jgi:fructose-1,6-bisphosphatase II|uniref:Fructose-1,6-bisphosphatase n=1 Tax=Tissierella carlieri TaxID=689904 RepID=A0ABT1S9J7_9FIRM|nr:MULTISPECIES: class II fructose-bisphosphatase [Tissierella]MBU5310695.1 class II fructose-bisphosphatase [Tissierella carlieri]MCQ4923158.1 class II fructose-bisphosphatase [Tissierella carlieri]MDU5079822.1 class II fructose-bisphosphatase [Bacillota bacterium]OZV13392.1 fructose-bisphosphatase class II [Tissierella sp. P1]